MKMIFRSITVAALACSMHFAKAQDTKIRFFGQPEFSTTKTDDKASFAGVDATGHYIKKDETHKFGNFNAGNYVLFVTSQLSERVSILSEASFNNSGNTSRFDVQRLFLRYYVKDYFSFRVGRMFTPIGYWNNQFTLGLALQPTIQRPKAILPASDGGVLQYRDVGVQFEGDNITKARFSYKLLLGNGVGYYGSNDKQDGHIATTVQVGAEPIEGLKVLGSAMFDRIEKGKPNPNGTIASLPDNGNLQLLVASIAYMNPSKKPEFIAELLTQKSHFNSLGNYNSHSYYVYGGYKITSKITPYALYNYTQAGRNTSTGDPYFSPIPVQIDLLTLGARYKFNANFIFKLEYEFTNTRLYYQPITAGGFKLDNGFANSAHKNSLRMQFAFMF